MLLIWGFKTRTKPVGSGTFHCPRCRAMRSYEWKRVDRYFTLYFIPVFRTKTLLDYVECGACLQTYKPAVLDAAVQTAA